MYTRCPECRTPFRITRAQLTARDGQVRCGKCHALFSATEHLLWFAPAEEQPAAAPAPADPPKRGRRARRRSPLRTGAPHDPKSPTVSDLSWQRPLRRLPLLAWAGLIAVLLLGLFAQAFYFYREELARHAALRPLIVEYCHWLDCRIDTREPWTAPELGSTTIAPHPRFANALRMRAVLVNRTDIPMSHPRMEIALTDVGGKVLTRRVFQPRDYLETPAADMQPNVAVPVLLDLTNPDGKAVGYEIRMLPPGETAPN